MAPTTPPASDGIALSPLEPPLDTLHKSHPLPSANPLPLSATQEAQVRTTYYANVRGHCAKEVGEFAACAKGRTFSMLWNCTEQRHAMNNCMIKHATPEEQDRAREQWFQMRMEKARKKREADAAEAVKDVVDKR